MTQVRGKPFLPKGDKWSDAARAAQAGESEPERAPVDFAEFARDLLANPRVRKAFVARWKRGEVSALELRMVSDAASTAAPRETDRQRAVAEQLVRLKRLSRGERLMLYRLTKKSVGEELSAEVAGYRWALVRDPSATATVSLPAFSIVYPPREPDLPVTQPLADASDRLRAESRERRTEQPEVLLIPPPGMLGVKDTHQWRNEYHRAQCRSCRTRWRRTGGL